MDMPYEGSPIIWGDDKKLFPRIKLQTELADYLNKTVVQRKNKTIRVFDRIMQFKQPSTIFPQKDDEYTVVNISNADMFEYLPEHFQSKYVDLMVIELDPKMSARRTHNYIKRVRDAILHCQPSSVLVVVKDQYSAQSYVNLKRWIYETVDWAAAAFGYFYLPSVFFITEDDLLQLIYSDRRIDFQGKATKALRHIKPIDAFLMYAIAYVHKPITITLDNGSINESPNGLAANLLGLTRQWYAHRGVKVEGRPYLDMEVGYNEFFGLRSTANPYRESGHNQNVLDHYRGPSGVPTYNVSSGLPRVRGPHIPMYCIDDFRYYGDGR